MLLFIDGGMHADRFRGTGESLVEVAFLDIGAEAINGFQTGRSINAEQIGAKAHIWAILEMCLVKGEMARSFVRVVGKVDIGNLGEKRSWIPGQRVECQAVDNDGEGLRF